MKKDTEKTDVIFRRHKKGGHIMALFPHSVTTCRGEVTVFELIGEHSNGDYSACIGMTVPAPPEEYKEVLTELESRGYNLRILRKQNRNKFMKSYREVNRVR